MYDGMAAWLAEMGWDFTEPRRLKAAGRLRGWEALCLNAGDCPPVGSAATRWDDATTARLIHRDRAGAPGLRDPPSGPWAVCVAADSGATTVATDLAVPHAEVLGFH